MNRRQFFSAAGSASAVFSSPRSLLGMFMPDQGGNPLDAAEIEAKTRQRQIAFPASDYTPFGYLDNPQHSAVLNRSGIIRSVPPVGFGFWARRLPWPYGEGALRPVNYLSFLHLSFVIDGKSLHRPEDFDTAGIRLVSHYHTKNVMSYDWTYNEVEIKIRYFLSINRSAKTDHEQGCDDAIVVMIDMRNQGARERDVTIHTSNIYGFPEENWWGSDGIAASFDAGGKVALSSIWAYGDIFAMGTDGPNVARKATSSEEEWNVWIQSNDLSSNTGTTSRFPGAVYTVQSFSLSIPPNRQQSMTACLARSVNRGAALDGLQKSLVTAKDMLEARLDEDDSFYTNAPLLIGDWASNWKHGWIYDLETLRMTMRPPLGIYAHPWDGMQIFTPRAVLGETLLDSLTLSYCDVQLAKGVILGMFMDSPAPNLPCSREDGSVNMICADGSEAGTAPTWGMPFHVIRSIYARDRDAEWIRTLYPYMAKFLEWWLENRTDKDGWFHSKCSWESGQDGSKRFIVAAENPAAVSDFVRTVDIEAAMADAFGSMVIFSEVADKAEDRERWKKLAEKRLETTRSMCVDGWFRDFDARNNQPIILKDYYDVMMLYPVAAGIATAEQMKAIAPRFKYFSSHPEFWLEWPSFMLPFSEAAWNTGLREFLATVIAGTAARVYSRTDERKTRSIAPFNSTLPMQYQYRIPGIANEFWPISADNPGGCENYGWGATLPALIIRNVIGFREFDDPRREEFQLAPAFPVDMMKPGSVYGITNLAFHGSSTNVDYHVKDGGALQVELTTRRATGKLPSLVKNLAGKAIATYKQRGNQASARFEAKNGEMYIISFA